MQVIGISEGDQAEEIQRLIEIDDAIVWSKRSALPLRNYPPSKFQLSEAAIEALAKGIHFIKQLPKL